MVSYSTDICSLSNTMSFNPAQPFNVTTSPCQVTQNTNMFIQVYSSKAQTFTILPKLVGITSTPLASGATISSNIAIQEVQIFSVPPATVTPGSLQQLKVSISTASRSLESYLNVDSPGGASCYSQYCLNGQCEPYVLPSCCTTLGNTYVTFVNFDQDVVAFNVSADWVVEAIVEPTPLALTGLIEGVISTPKVLYQYQLPILNVSPIPISFLSTSPPFSF
jgi:hypothetical protein